MRFLLRRCDAKATAGEKGNLRQAGGFDITRLQDKRRDKSGIGLGMTGKSTGKSWSLAGSGNFAGPRRGTPEPQKLASRPASLLQGTALATGVIAGLIWAAGPAHAANECGPAPAGGGTVVCTPAGNTYPNGVTYSNQLTDLTVVTQSGVTINAIGLNSGIIVSGSGSPNLGVTANAGTTITTGAVGIQVTNAAAAIINSGASITSGSTGIDASNNGTVSVVNSGQITTLGNPQNAGIGALVNGGAVSILNTGTINSSGAGVSALSVPSGTVSIINSGQISGITGISIYGAPGANVVNTGTITGTTVAIDNVSGFGATIDQNGGIITGAINLSGNADVLNIRGGTIAGNIIGLGTDTINFALGSNTFIYGAAFGFSGINQVNVSSGTVILNGSNSATNVTISGGNLEVGDASSPAAALTATVGVTGGTLSGFGTVIGGVSIGNGGTLAPGGPSSIGTLTVQGNLVFASAASYLVMVSSTTSSRTAVTGTAALAGTVQVASPTSSYRFNMPYTILTSAGLGGTTFNAVVTPTGIAGSLTYPNGSDVQLSLASNLGGIAGASANQRAVGAVLDAAFNAAGTTGGFGAIFSGNVLLNLTQASGETAVGSQQTTFDAMTQFMGVMTDPFIGGRGDGATGGAGATPFAEESNASAYTAGDHRRTGSERDAYGMITKAVPRLPNFEQRWSVWAAGFGGSQTTDGNATLGSNTTAGRLGAVAVGADYRFSPDTLAGFALTGGATSFSVANGGSGRSDLFQAGAFIRHNVGPAYLTGALAYGWQDITTDRTVTAGGIDQLRAQFNANAFSGRLEGGYRFVTPWMGGIGITPYAAAQFTTFDLPAYAERDLSGLNTFALSYAAKTVTDSRSELGLRSDKSWAVGDAILTVRGRAAWAHDFQTNRSIAATFQSLPGASFVVNGAAPAHDAALTTASAEMKFVSGFSLAATFEGEFSGVTRSYAGKGVARYQW
jgi:uncharacterized protein with beta-barrel porin domain